MKLSASLKNQFLTKDQVLDLRLKFIPETNEELKNLSEVNCSFDIIQYDKDIYINPFKHFSQLINQKEEEIQIKINVNNLTPGIYCLYRVVVPTLGNGNERQDYVYEFEDFLFEINDNNLVDVKSHYRLLNEANQIISNYNYMYQTGIGLEKTNATKEFECYLFCSDLYIGKEMLLGKCKVFPYKSLDNRNIYDYMSDFVKSKGLGELPERPKEFEDYNSYSQPCAIIYFPVVVAHTPLEASTIAYEHASHIINSFSLTNDSYATIIGDLLVDKKNHIMHHRCRYSPYMGNLFVGMEQPKKLFSIAKSSQTDSLKKFYLELFIECSREKRNKYAYFRYWNLLETIARNKNFIGKPKKNIYNDIMLNRKLQPIKIQNHAYELVFELIRDSYEKVGKKSNNPTNLKQNLLEDRLNIWYQRRNCIAHRGGCLYKNKHICDRTNDNFNRCYLALEEMQKKSDSTDNFVDEYLFNLRDISREILLIELNAF